MPKPLAMPTFAVVKVNGSPWRVTERGSPMWGKASWRFAVSIRLEVAIRVASEWNTRDMEGLARKLPHAMVVAALERPSAVNAT